MCCFSGDRFTELSVSSSTIEIKSFGAVDVTIGVSTEGNDWDIVVLQCPGSDSDWTAYILDLDSLVYHCTNA